MPEVFLHRLSGTKKALDACRLVEKLYLAGERVVVWFQDEGRAAIFDQYLWTFSDTAFVPHRLSEGEAVVEEPVALVVGALRNPNGASRLVVVERGKDLGATWSFGAVHELLAAGEEAGVAQLWAQAGFAVSEVRGVERF